MKEDIGSIATIQTIVTFARVRVPATVQLYRDAIGPVVIAAQLGCIKGFVPWDDLSEVERVQILEAPGVRH